MVGARAALWVAEKVALRVDSWDNETAAPLADDLVA